jgi:3-hydroxyisobutyrate dehydrogenase-like beta-hydroxyacid dehydrogenase
MSATGDSKMKSALGFVGLGNMGLAMAVNLQAAGFALRVYTRTPGRADPLVETGARLAASPAETLEPDGIVVTMLADDAALEQVVMGENGIGGRLGSGGVHLSMSTIAPETARFLSDYHAQRGAAYVAAPVFGRPDAAAARRLWICTSGPQLAKDRVRPLLAAMGQKSYDFGEKAETANVVKLAGNFLIMAAIEAMAEAQTLGEKQDIDPAQLAAFFGETIFSCPVYQNYGRIIAGKAFEPAGFRLSLGLKDANLVLGNAAQAAVPMPIASLLRDRFVSGLAHGRGSLDWSAIALSASDDAGIV